MQLIDKAPARILELTILAAEKRSQPIILVDVVMVLRIGVNQFFKFLERDSITDPHQGAAHHPMGN